jgi:hypothetical protein
MMDLDHYRVSMHPYVEKEVMTYPIFLLHRVRLYHMAAQKPLTFSQRQTVDRSQKER